MSESPELKKARANAKYWMERYDKLNIEHMVYRNAVSDILSSMRRRPE